MAVFSTVYEYMRWPVGISVRPRSTKRIGLQVV